MVRFFRMLALILLLQNIANLAPVLLDFTAIAHASNDDEDDKDDDDRRSERGYSKKLNELHEGVQNKTLLPLSDLKAIVSARFGGSIIEIEPERKRGRWQYEFKVINRQGRLLEVYVDAQTGRVIKVEND